MPEIECERCEDTFHTHYDEMRFRSGSFYDDERHEHYDQICEDCHRDLR